ncbi:MAG TPA: thermonuclease family protein [Rhizobiaceae bacterium]|nr:thermonuclease family protein [Rhizobiaceae bacterium]
MLLRRIALPASGVAAAALLLIAYSGVEAAREPQATVPQEAPSPAQSPATPALPLIVPDSGAQPSLPPTVSRPGHRAVAPDVVAPPQIDMTLERAEPRAPLGEFGGPIIRRREPVTLLYRPVAESAGRIRSGDVVVTLAGIEPVAADETCRDDAGKAWNCGVRARAALRAFLRGRAMACDLPPDTAVKEATATCRVGKQDISQWLAEAGWARATVEPYAAAADEARRAGRGIFGKAPVTPPLAGPELAPEGALPAQ